MEWDVISFETNRGQKPIEKFIKSRSKAVIAKIMKEVRLLIAYGPNLGMPHSKRLNRDILELRIRGKEEIRILYVFLSGKFYLLHAFKKQSQEIPKKEIEVALSRLRLLT